MSSRSSERPRATTVVPRTSDTHVATPPRRLRLVGPDIVVALVPLLGLAGATWWLFGLPASYLLTVLGLYGLMGALLLWYAAPFQTHRGLGPANRITLVRSTLVLPLAALVFQPGVGTQGLSWWVILCATVAFLMDSLDGRVARGTGTTSAFGARFDMELDAFLILVLSVLVWQGGKAGGWVILIGVLRYLFVGAGAFRKELRASLPESYRRKLVCVVQGVALLLCLGPMVSSGVASILAGGALTLLLYSFAVDIGWLLRIGRADGTV